LLLAERRRAESPWPWEEDGFPTEIEKNAVSGCFFYQRKQSAQKQSAHWIWEYRRGLRRKDKRETHVDQRLAMYVFGLGIRNVPCEFIPKAEHEIVGNSAMYREKARKGTGEFKIQCEGGPWNVTFDGFAIFSPVPKQVMEQIRRHLKVAPVDDFV
jgi:hypothetical protein